MMQRLQNRHFLLFDILLGKSLRNRDHETHCSINVCSSLERRPRCLGGCQRGGGT